MVFISFARFWNCRWRVDTSVAVRPVFGMVSMDDCTESSYPEKVRNHVVSSQIQLEITVHDCVA